MPPMPIKENMIREPISEKEFLTNPSRAFASISSFNRIEIEYKETVQPRHRGLRFGDLRAFGE
jgi:hypothetical protein